jgi:sugar phosphate isomerase/epimerase
MGITRREFLVRATAGGVAGVMMVPAWRAVGETDVGIRLSACDWSLDAGGPSGLEIARRVRLDGLEVSAGGPADTLKIADPEYRKQYKDAVAQTGVVVSSVAMGLLNDAPLATDPRGPVWLEQTIEAAEDLGAKVILLAFFGKGDLLKDRELKNADIDVVVTRLKEAAPKAGQAGIILGIENTLSADDNVRILDRIQHDAVRVYYDAGNSTDNGYDVAAEIRRLGDRICQFHFKDGRHYLGEGRVKMEPVAEAIRAIGYRGWIVLETSCPSKNRDADFQRNADYVRKLLATA